MEFQRRNDLRDSEKREILQLWNKEYPEKLAYASLHEFEAYLQELTEQSHILLLNENKKILGWYFDFVREDEKWFAMILDTSVQGKGLGTRLLRMAQEKEPQLNGWVIDHSRDRKQNGEPYRSPLDFYLRNGFELLADCRLELHKISAVKIQWKR